MDVKLNFTTFSGHDVDTTTHEGGTFHAQDGATITMVGTVIANNGAAGTPMECTSANGGLFLGNNNLAADTNCPGVIGVATFVDPVLADNDGLTLTHALLEGSNAINSYIGIDCPPTDQRGVARPIGGACDLGAYESSSLGISSGVTVSKTAISVGEGGATDTYTVVLTSQPTSDVTITITDDAQCAANAESLTFTSENWNMAQTVTVSAVDDVNLEGEHACTITHVVSSADENYASITLANISGTVSDDEVASSTEELLDNGGFEVAGISAGLPTNWTVQNPSGDKRVCPPNINNLYGGLCAFKFTGSTTDASKLTQNVDLTAHTFSAGDALTVSAYVKGNNPTAKIKVTLFVYYTGNATPSKTNLTIRRNATFTQHSLPVYTLSNGDISQIKLVFTHQSSAGTLWLDDVSLIHTIPAIVSRDDAMGLPTAPETHDGFRDNN